MNNPSRILLLMLAWVMPCTARDGHGYLNFVNMVPGDPGCEIRIDSKNPAPGGLRPGNDTGWFMVPAGTASLTISTASMKQVKRTIRITEGAGSLVAIYLHAAPQSARPSLRTKSFPTYQADGRALRFVSLCPSENRFEIGTLPLAVEPFETTPLPNWNGARLVVKKNGRKIGTLPRVREAQPFYLLVGTDLDANHITALVFAGEVVAPPWRRKMKAQEPAEAP